MHNIMLGSSGARMARILYVCRVGMRTISMMGKLCTLMKHAFSRAFLNDLCYFSVYTGTGDHHRIFSVGC